MRSSMSPTSPDEPKVKGVAFRSVLAALQELVGPATVDRTLATMPDDDAEMLRYRIVQTGWYPISLYRALWAAILRDRPEDYEFVRTLGAISIRRDVTGVYRMLFKVLSPETVMSFSGKLFGNYYDTGSLTIDGERRHVLSKYDGCVGFDRAMWEEQVGCSYEMLRLAGARKIDAKIVRGGQLGAPNCWIEITWA